MNPSFKTAAPMLALAMSVAMITACAKTESQKANDQAQQAQTTAADADKAVADLGASMPKLTTAEEPTASWDAQALKNYEELVKLNEDKLIKAQSFEGRNGVVVSNRPTVIEARKVIDAKKMALQNARTKQGEKAAEQTKDARVDQLKATFTNDAKFLNDEGIPMQSWPAEKKAAYEAALNRVDATLKEIETIDGNDLYTVAHKAANAVKRGLYNAAK